MSERTACPADAELLQLLAAEPQEAERSSLAGHLETCSQCQARLEALVAGAEAWRALRKTRVTGEEQPAPALRQIMEKLKTETSCAGGFETQSLDDFLPYLSPSSTPVELGRLGHYRVLEIVGRGGMGVVLRAFDEKLQRVVALKLLLPHLARRSTARERFVREARLSASVEHENVVGIYSVEDSGALPYLVMQFVPGQSLQERLDAGRPLTVSEVVRLGLEVASGLGAAHAKGLVHRDVKPANILFDSTSNRAKITDFGLARAVADSSITDSGVIAGTPLYMAPEQAEGASVDHRADLFSLGAVLYEACTGTPPFMAETPAAILRLVCDKEPAPIKSLNPSVPDWLSAVIRGLLAKNPDQRIQSAGEVVERLRLGANVSPRGRRRTPARVRLGLMIALAIGLAATGGYFLLRPRTETVPSQDTPTHEELPARANPLDSLRAEDVPLPLRAVAGLADPARAPKELVAALADARFMVSNPGLASWPAQSRDGKILAVPCGDQVSLFFTQTGSPVGLLTGFKGRVFALAFHPDGNRLAITVWDSSHNVIVWDLSQNKVVRTLKGHRATPLRVAYSLDGKWLASTSDDKTARVWDAETGNEKWTLTGHTDHVGAVTFAPDSKRLLTGSRDKSVKVWGVETGTLVTTLGGHTESVTALAFTPDGSRFASGSARECVVRDWADLQEVQKIPQPAAWLSFLPDNKTLLLARHDYTDASEHIVQRVDAATGTVGDPLPLKSRGGHAVFHLDPNEGLLYTMRVQVGESRVRVINPANGAERFPHVGHVGAVYAVAVSPDGKFIVTGGSDRRLLLWDATRLKSDVPPVRCLKTCGGEVVSVAFSKNGSLLAAASLDGTIQLWDVTEDKSLGTLQGASRLPSRIAFNPDGAVLAAGGEHGDIRLWDIPSGTPRSPLKWHEGAVRAVAFSPDGKLLVSAGLDGTLQVGEWESGRQLGALRRKSPVKDVAFHPGGATIASVGDGPDASLRLWNFGSGHEVIHPIHDCNTVCVAYDPTGRFIATGATDARLRLWEPMGDLRRLRTWGPGAFGFVIHDVAFTPDGRYLVTANANGLSCILRLGDRNE